MPQRWPYDEETVLAVRLDGSGAPVHARQSAVPTTPLSSVHAEWPKPVRNCTDGRGRRRDAHPCRQSERASDVTLAPGVDAGRGRGGAGSVEGDGSAE